MQMLKNWNPEQIPEKEDVKARLSTARARYMNCRWLLRSIRSR